MLVERQERSMQSERIALQQLQNPLERSKEPNLTGLMMTTQQKQGTLLTRIAILCKLLLSSEDF